MRDYESWSFWDKAFLMAILVSLLWHFFWFFSISIVVGPGQSSSGKSKPQIVSLGPVLDDSIFRALVETKPEISETFYRRLSDFSQAVEVEAKSIERHDAGDVVSVPVGQKFLNSMRVLVGGEKLSPDYDFSHVLKVNYPEESTGVEGEARDRRVLSRPSFPKEAPGLNTSLKTAPTELEFVVDASGNVKEVEVLVSCGLPDADSLWVRYLRKWQFDALGLDKAALDQKGRIKFQFKTERD